MEGATRLADAADAIVYYVPDGGAPAPTRASTAEVMTRDRRFVPRVTVVPVGATVKFPNADPIKHNVFSVSPGNRFDVGLYGKGTGKAETMRAPGVVRLFCNVHRSMSAFVLVLDTPYYTQVDGLGHFALDGVPAGKGTLHVWHPRAESWEQRIDVPAHEPIAVKLEATLPPVPKHLNKFGRPYPDRDSDEDYR